MRGISAAIQIAQLLGWSIKEGADGWELHEPDGSLAGLTRTADPWKTFAQTNCIARPDLNQPDALRLLQWLAEKGMRVDISTRPGDRLLGPNETVVVISVPEGYKAVATREGTGPAAFCSAVCEAAMVALSLEKEGGQ